MNDNPQHSDSNEFERVHPAVKRENPDLEPKGESAPLWVFIASMAVMLVGGGYAGAYIGGFGFDENAATTAKISDPRPIVFDPTADLSPFDLAMKRGATVYGNCQGCHMANGNGQPGLIPPLAGSEWVQQGSERLIRVLLHGLSGPVSVKGQSYTNIMPPQGHLSDKEIAYVLTFIRNSWDNKSDLITPEMVQKVREDSKGHVGAWTEAALNPFKDKDVAGPDAPPAP